MEQLIRVEMNDGSICRMAVKAFNMFLAQNKISRFERSDGWVTIGKDMLRNMTATKHYTGPERRSATAPTQRRQRDHHAAFKSRSLITGSDTYPSSPDPE